MKPQIADTATGTDVAVVDTTAVMDAGDAKRLTARIRLLIGSIDKSGLKLLGLVREARSGNAHVALGYPSWPAYIADVLGEDPLQMPRDDRQELVALLRGEGMSTRAIAPIVGVDHSTIVRDLATGANAPVDDHDGELDFGDDVVVQPPATVVSLDGRRRPATKPKVVKKAPEPVKPKAATPKAATPKATKPAAPKAAPPVVRKPTRAAIKTTVMAALDDLEDVAGRWDEIFDDARWKKFAAGNQNVTSRVDDLGCRLLGANRDAAFPTVYLREALIDFDSMLGEDDVLARLLAIHLGPERTGDIIAMLQADLGGPKDAA